MWQAAYMVLCKHSTAFFTISSQTKVPGIVDGYIDLARNPAHRGSSSGVAILMVSVSSLVLEMELLLDRATLLK